MRCRALRDQRRANALLPLPLPPLPQGDGHRPRHQPHGGARKSHLDPGEELLQRYKLPEAERFSTCFCTRCGSPMPRQVPELHLLVIPAGSLDSMPWIEPEARIFWGSRAEWSCAAGDLPVFAEYPTSA